MRRYIIFGISLFLLLGSFSAIFATQDLQRYMLRGYIDPTQVTDLPYRIPRLGVNADLLQYDAEELAQQLAWMDEAGVHWIRQFIYWDEIEPEQGQFEWDALDTITNALVAYPNMQLQPVFMNSPLWARDSEVMTSPPSDPIAIIPFLQAFTSRYGNSITYYQVWDEPNLDDAWGLENPSPAEYVALLSESYRAIHSRDINAVVIAAALAPTIETRGQNIADDLYLQQLYDLGAADYFDAVAGKPYGFDASPLDRDVSRDTLNFSRLILLREIMVANGDADKALWASNWGWNHLPNSWEGDASIWGSIDEPLVYDYVSNALNRADREWAWLGGMIIQHWQPNADAENPLWGFSVINQENQRTILWQALADYDDSTTARNGLYHPRTAFAEYSGLWTFSERGADIGWLETSDSQLRFNFTGRDIALRLREGDYFAFLYPTVDGHVANNTPLDANGNAYISLRSENQRPELSMIAVSRNLMDEAHELHVIADRGWDQWALAGYAVSSGDLAIPYRQQLTIGWIAALASLVATIIAGYTLPWRQMINKMQGIMSILHVGLQFAITVITSIALMFGLLMSFGLPEPQLFKRDLAEQALLIILTSGLIVVKLPLLLAFFALILLFWLIYNHIEWGLMLTLVYAPFFLFPVELYIFFFPMSELLILITSAAWLLKLFVQWGAERQSSNDDYPIQLGMRWHPLDGLMIIWLLIGCLAVLWSADKGVAFTELRTLFIEPMLFYGIFRTLKLNDKAIQQMVKGLVFAGILVSVIGLFLYITGDGVIIAEGGARRLSSVYGSPNNVGLLLGRIIPFVITGALLLREKMQWLLIGISGLLMITVVLTQSVGALLIGVPAAITAVLIATYGKKALPILGLFALIGILVTLGLTQVSTRFASLLDLSTGTNFIRIRVWESTLEILSDYPLTGLGLDQFLPVFSGEYVRPDAIADPDLSHPHNIVLDFWIRLGILGVGWLILFMITFWRNAVKILYMERNPQKRILLIGSIGAMTALIAHGMIDNSIYVNDLVYIFVLIVGIIAYLSSDTQPESDAIYTGQ
ncbi:MAG: O-antigen ligase family protein [Phototrophicaceae bacterium]